MVAPIHKAMLQHLTCDICFQYLSVLPIKVTKSGMKFCGRCLDLLPNDSAWSIYNRIAKYCAFDCVNRFSGCTAKLEIHEVVSHEKTCVFRNNKCCFCDFQGNWCQIVEHCKRIHPDRVVTKTLQINYNEPNTFLVVVDTNICLVRVRRNASQKTLEVDFLPLTKNSLAIDQMALKFYLPHMPSYFKYIFSYTLEKRACQFKISLDTLIGYFGKWRTISCDVEIDMTSTFVDLKLRESAIQSLQEQLEVRENFARQLNDTSVNIMKKLFLTLFTCKVCKMITSRNSYFCPNYHCFCLTCLKSTCSECCNLAFTRVTEGTFPIMVECDWPECGESTNFMYYMEHKSKCSRRPYKCPLQKCDVVVYSTTDLVTHWHCRTPKLISNKIIECDNFDKYEYYLALGTELYHVMINFSEKSISVIIEETNVFANRIEFRLSGFCTAYKTFYELQLDRIGDKMEYTSNNSSPKGYLMSKLQISFGNL